MPNEPLNKRSVIVSIWFYFSLEFKSINSSQKTTKQKIKGKLKESVSLSQFLFAISLICNLHRTRIKSPASHFGRHLEFQKITATLLLKCSLGQKSKTILFKCYMRCPRWAPFESNILIYHIYAYGKFFMFSYPPISDRRKWQPNLP